MLSIYNEDHHELAVQQSRIKTKDVDDKVKPKIAFTDIKNQIAADSAASRVSNLRKTSTTPHKPVTESKSRKFDVDEYESCSYDSGYDFFCGKEFTVNDINWNSEENLKDASASSSDSAVYLDAFNSSCCSIFCHANWEELDDDDFTDSGFDNNFSENIAEFNSTHGAADMSLALPDFDWDL